MLLLCFLTRDRQIFSKIGYFGIFLGVSAIILWSIFVSCWSTPGYKRDSKIFYTSEPSDLITNISDFLIKYSYTCDSTDSDKIILKSTDKIINWFCGDVIIKKYPNRISIQGAKIILSNIGKLKLT